ncbi:MAG TPA: metalloregulator ArsR/SmtB family transcription factor [Solirubrobacteraceae bacterium]
MSTLVDVDRVQPDAVGAVFAALADPTRRHVVATLARRESATPTGLAAELPMTRQAVAKHLGMLSAAGLVSSERVGRETRYALTPEGLGDAAAWMAEVGAAWDGRLGRLARLLGER